MQKILITGATGMLGSKIAEYLSKTEKYKVFVTGRKSINNAYDYTQADLLNAEERNNLLHHVQPDVIVHCAANVNLNDCELNPENAYKIHVHTSEQLAAYNPENCKIIYISTDSVFDGNKKNYTEEDKPAPLNIYAETKFKGEHAVAETNFNHLILRTNIYGFNSAANNNSLFEWIYKNLSAGNAITGFTDIIFNPLYTGQVADIIINCLEKNLTGVFHAGCEEEISKYTFAKKIAGAFSLDKSLIQPGNSNSVSSTLKRPKNTTLNHTALDKALKKKYNLQDGITQLKSDFLVHKKSHESY